MPRLTQDPQQRRATRTVAVARGLGWFSIALGLTELLAPRMVAKMVGVAPSDAVIRIAGLREIVCGIGLLSARRQAPFAWARVAGDVVDIATLAKGASATRRPSEVLVAGSLMQLASITALDVCVARALSSPGEAMSSPPARAPIQRDYAGRRGFARDPDNMRGAALQDFEAPRDMVTPPALQSYLRRTKSTSPST